MYKINGNDIDVYVVIRAYRSNDVILRNYTTEEVMCLGSFKWEHESKAIKKRNEIKHILEFLGAKEINNECKTKINRKRC